MEEAKVTVKNYYNTLKDEGEYKVMQYKNTDVVLNCLFLDDSKKHKYFSKRKDDNGNVVWQYDIRSLAKSPGWTCSGRPKAYRIPFLLSDKFNDKDYTVSHLCHNNWCLNPDHHVLEPLAVNKGRNGCPGECYCKHGVKCLVPGPYSHFSGSIKPSVFNKDNIF